MSELNRISVTDMHHSLPTGLEIAPFDDLAATETDGMIAFYSFDTFRRLYNDAGESLLAYRSIASHYKESYEDMCTRCQKLEYRLHELTDE